MLSASKVRCRHRLRADMVGHGEIELLPLGPDTQGASGSRQEEHLWVRKEDRGIMQRIPPHRMEHHEAQHLGTHAPGDGFNLAAVARNVRLPAGAPSVQILQCEGCGSWANVDAMLAGSACEDSCQRRRVYEVKLRERVTSGF